MWYNPEETKQLKKFTILNNTVRKFLPFSSISQEIIQSTYFIQYKCDRLIKKIMVSTEEENSYDSIKKNDIIPLDIPVSSETQVNDKIKVKIVNFVKTLTDNLWTL